MIWFIATPPEEAGGAEQILYSRNGPQIAGFTSALYDARSFSESSHSASMTACR
mgnify:CR=1 FL=1